MHSYVRVVNLKGSILYDFNCMIFWKRQNCGGSKKFRSYRERSIKYMKYKEGSFREVKLFHVILTDGGYVPKLMDRVTSRLNPNVNWEL